jgi:hypothetical protein
MKSDKPPRRRNERCDYCNTDKGGLAAFNDRQHVFCGPWCHAWYIHCVYRPPDHFADVRNRPPEQRMAGNR